MLIHRIKLALQKRTGAAQTKKSIAWWQSRGVECQPEASFVLESHNKSEEILHVVSLLRQWPGRKEIIVIDDGSSAEHAHRLAEGLTGVNEWLIRCNDLYENITYTRALHMARAPYVCLMQDDDTFDSCAWVDRGLELMRKHNRMAVLGGKDALDIVFEDDRQTGHGRLIKPEGDFAFCPAVNRAPMWINRELYILHLKEMRQDMQPFQYDDYEMCARTWLCGLQVGWYDAGFRSLTVGGMRLYNNTFIGELCQRNGNILYRLYRDRIEEIHKLAGV